MLRACPPEVGARQTITERTGESTHDIPNVAEGEMSSLDTRLKAVMEAARDGLRDAVDRLAALDGDTARSSVEDAGEEQETPRPPGGAPGAEPERR